MHALRLAVIVSLVLTIAAERAEARPQWSAQGQLGVVGVGESDGAWRRTKLDLGLKVEDLWLRESPNDFGIGPYVEMRTAAFRYGEYGAGVVALIPTSMTYPLWLGGGTFAHREAGSFSGGGNAFVAWGARDFNYHSSYAMAFGLLVDARVHRGDTPGFDVVLAATIDLEALALPWIYLLSAVTH